MEIMETSSSSSSESESEEEITALASRNIYHGTSDGNSEPFVNLNSKELEEDAPEKNTAPQRRVKLASSLQSGISLSGNYLNIFSQHQPGATKDKLKQLSLVSKLDELESQNIVVQPGFEKQHTVLPYLEGRKKIRRERLKERDKTKGAAWFNMPATEVTEEIKNDLAILQMRNSLDPKRFYKRGNEKIAPKYFQIGTVVESPADFYHARIPKKQRKRTLVEELLADAEFRKYQKRKYAEALKNQPQKFYHSSQKRKKMKQKGSSNEGPKKHKLKKTK